MENKNIKLPEPKYSGELSLEQVLKERRSVRTYTGAPISLQELSQLLWAGQGITHPAGKRTAPSARATYPLTLYVLVNKVTDLLQYVYKYVPVDHSLELVKAANVFEEFTDKASSQGFIKECSVVIIIAGDYKITGPIDEKQKMYIHAEAGFVAQNIYLQTVSLKLGTVYIGAFTENEVKRILEIPPNESVFTILPVGRK